MTRTGGGWIPDGRARAIRTDCEASLAALDGLAIDLYLIHAPDPRTPWRTSVRALARLVGQGLVRHVGVSNVNRRQLDEALELAPVTAVQVALSPYDDRALRGGVVERCAKAGNAERSGEQDEAPEPEHRDQHQRKLMIIIDVLDAPRRKDKSGGNQDADRNCAAEGHAKPGDRAVHSEIALVPFVFNSAR